MELRHLRFFIAAAEAGSLTEAAQRRLFTSQPSLSRQIRDLEAQVGVPLLTRSTRGVELTAAGSAFIEHARLALNHAQAAIEAARRAAQPLKQHFAVGFLTGQEMIWLPKVMSILHAELPNIDITVSSDYSTDLAEAVACGRLDAAFMRAEPGYDLQYMCLAQETLVVLMPKDHELGAKAALEPQHLIGEPFIAMGEKARVLRAVIDRYLEQAGVQPQSRQEVDNPAMVMSLVASTGGLTLIPSYVQNLMPASVISRPLAGVAPTIGLSIGYSAHNPSPVLQLFLSQIDELRNSAINTIRHYD